MVHLDLVYCIKQVVRYRTDSQTKWTCAEEKCFSCEGYQCGILSSLSVYNDEQTAHGDTSSSTLGIGCRKGNTVKLDGDDNSFFIDEIAVIGSLYEGQHLCRNLKTSNHNQFINIPMMRSSVI